MNNYVVIADTNCEFNQELQERFKLDAIAPNHIIVNGVDHVSDNEWQLFKSPDEFYKQLRDKKNSISTTPPSVEEMKETFIPFLKEGKDVIFLALSGALSGTYNFGLMAKKELNELYPERRVEVIDTLRYGVAISLFVTLITSMRDEGKSLDEVMAKIEEVKYNLHQMGPMDDLMFLARKGRISKGKAFMGTMVGVKPLGEFNRQGMTTVLTKAMGIKKALDFTIEYVKRTIVDPENQILFIANTDRRKNAELLRDLVISEIKPKEVILLDCGPSSGTNIGPGLAAVYYWGTPISEDLSTEQALMDEISGK